MESNELNEKVKILILKLSDTIKANNCNAVIGIYINDNDSNVYYTDVIANCDDDDAKNAIFEWVSILNEQREDFEESDEDDLIL